MTIDAGTCPTRPHFAHFNRLELSCHSDSVYDFTLNPETLIPVPLSTIASISPLDVCGLTGISVVVRARTEDSRDEATAEL